MTVTALVTRNDITATASQTSFTYTFRVLAATDMDVYQNGVLLSSGYTVNDVGNTTGGTVVLDSGVPVGQIVSLVLAMPLDRTTNYQNSGKFLADDVNEDFDKIYIGAVQNENEGGRSLRLKDVEPPTVGVDMTIPLKADRLGKFLAFDDVTGAPVVNSGTGADAYDSAAWSAFNFTGNGSTTAFVLGIVPHSENNTQVYIDGVYQQKDGYSLSAATITFSVAPPNLSTIEVMVTSALAVGATSSDLVSYTPAGTGAVATTVQAKLRESVSVKDFGAVGDGVTDDMLAIQAAIDSGAGKIFFPAGTYAYLGAKVNEVPALRLRSNVEFYGEGAGKTILRQNAAYWLFGYGYQLSDVSNPINNIVFRDMEMIMDNTPTFSQFEYILQLGSVANILVNRVKFVGWRGDAINIGTALAEEEVHQENITIQNCIFDGVNKDNRQAISITDGTNIFIQNNKFINCTRADMPGCIDIEPNHPIPGAPSIETLQRANNIHITNNSFENSGAAAISLQLSKTDDYVVAPGPFYFTGNTVKADVATDMKIYMSPSTGGSVSVTANNPVPVIIEGNYFNANGGSVIYGFHGLSILSNKFKNAFQSLVIGKTDALTQQVAGLVISGNSFLGTNVYPNIIFGSCNNVVIVGNRFQATNNANANNIRFYGDSVTSVCSGITVSGNQFYRAGSLGAIDVIDVDSATVSALTVNNCYDQDANPVIYTVATSSTFLPSGTGATASAAVDLSWNRVGNWVTVNIPAFEANTGTGATTISSQTALPTLARPITTTKVPVYLVKDNGVATQYPGVLIVGTNGILQVRRDGIDTAYTNSVLAGLFNDVTITYYVG